MTDGALPVVGPSPEARRAAAILDEDAETALARTDAAATLTVPVAATAGGVAWAPAAVVVGAVAWIAVAAAGRGWLRLRGRAARTRALSDAAGLVGRVALRLRLSPSPEVAARFAARTGRGRLAASLGDSVRAARGDPRSGLDAFADDWGEAFPALERACSLLDAAASAPPDERGRLLDRATTTVREATRDRAAAFAGEVRSTVTALYAFGVLLPLALVGVLPAAGAAGVALPLPVFVVVYDAVLPVAVVAAAADLLADRPVAFPAAPVPRSHPDVPDSVLPGLVAGGSTGGAAALLAGAVGDWFRPLAAIGVGVGVACVVRYRPVAAVRDRVRDAEAGLPDAATLLGRRVADGEAVETALGRVADSLPGATGEALSRATDRIDRVGEHPERALTGEDGPFEGLPSRRGAELGAMIALGIETGAPAGDALVDAGSQLDALERIESEARRELAATTRTLSNTAALFGPLVGGATVALSRAMIGRAPDEASLGAGASSGLAGGSTAIAPAEVGLVVGTYVLLSAAILTALAGALERGFDRALLGYRVGIAVTTATIAFGAAVVGVSPLP